MTKDKKKDEPTVAAPSKNGDKHYRITKIISKTDSVTVNAEKILKSGEVRVSNLTAPDKANPEFYKAIADLGKLMVKRIEKFATFDADIRCTHVSLDYAKEAHRRMGMIVTLHIPTTDMPGGMTLNTPRLIERMTGVKGGGALMSDQIQDAVEKVIEEADKYRKSDRAQKDLAGAKAAEEADEDNDEDGEPAVSEGEEARVH